MKDFFISYTHSDTAWAEWIAQVLEEAGYTTAIQAWDFRPGSNFVGEMQRATVGSKRTIAVLSPSYMRSLFAMAEWAAAFAADPDGSQGKLVPVLVREVDQDSLGVLAPLIQVRLSGLGESFARETLVKGLTPGRIRPENVRFPGTGQFPGTEAPPDPEVAAATLATLPAEEVPKPGTLPAGSRMPLAANPLFVGREEDLKTLARQLKAGETSAVNQVEIAAATGLGGIGKTQLASEFVHRYGRFFAGGVFWMSFADGTSVPAEVAACGRALGLHSSFDALTPEQQVRLVEEAWQSPLPRLLVFDNCEDEDLLNRWRPRFGGARVLVTSRRAEWDAALSVKTVPITTLPRPASVDLLRRFRPDAPTEDSALSSIAEELGDLPLALHLAGSYLRKYRHTSFGELTTYLESLRNMDVLAHESLGGRGAGELPTKHEAHVGRTFALSFERLDPANATDFLAIKLLVRAAWFAPGEPIPRSLLLRSADPDSGGPYSELDEEDALRRLLDLGLLEVTSGGTPRIHRLVAAWARGVPGTDQARSDVEAVMVMEAKSVNEVGNPAPIRSWLPHLRLITDRANSLRETSAVLLCDELGVHLWQAGDYSGARPYLETAVALHDEAPGRDQTAIANSLNNLGRVLHSQGDYASALAAYERALAIHERVFGTDHPETARSLNDLAVLFDAQGNYREARLRFEQALAIREKVLGPEHRDTALSLSNLGGVEFERGHSYEERALAVREKTLGPDHPDTAMSLANLGSDFLEQGDLEAARRHYERALAIRERVLGPEHPDTASSLRDLGNLLHQEGDSAMARHYYDRALAVTARILGPEHPVVAQILNDTGQLLEVQGDLTGARQHYERALEIREHVLGPEHLDTARTIVDLADICLSQKNSARARYFLQRALKVLHATVGPGHPEAKRARRKLSLLPGARRIKKPRLLK